MNLKEIRKELSLKDYMVVDSKTTDCEVVIKRNKQVKVKEDDEIYPQFTFQEIRMLSALKHKREAAKVLLMVKEVFPLAHMTDGY